MAHTHEISGFLRRSAAGEGRRHTVGGSTSDSGPKEGYMLALWTKLVSRFSDDKGASMVEYALLVVLIAIIAIVAIRVAGQQVSGTFDSIASELGRAGD